MCQSVLNLYILTREGMSVFVCISEQELIPYTRITNWFLKRRWMCLLDSGIWDLGTFAKLRKVAISFVMSFPSSVCPHGITHLSLEGFIWNCNLNIFKTLVQKTQISLESSKNKRYFNLDLSAFMTISRRIHLRMKNLSNKRCRENKAHISCAIAFSRKSWPLWYNAEIYSGYSHTIRIRNTYFFFTAIMVTRTRFNVTCIRTFPTLLEHKSGDFSF
jgi:hypothetical protein